MILNARTAEFEKHSEGGGAAVSLRSYKFLKRLYFSPPIVNTIILVTL